jgi:hypothetical protein
MALRDELTARGLGYLLKSWTCPTSNPAEWRARLHHPAMHFLTAASSALLRAIAPTLAR